MVKKWTEIKPGKIGYENFVISELDTSDKKDMSSYVLYDYGKIVGFYDKKTDAKRAAERLLRKTKNNI